MNQTTLLNTYWMEKSFKERKRIARAAKAAALSSQRLAKIAGGNTSAVSAGVPAPSKTPWQEYLQEQEFHLPDEDRIVVTLKFRCECGWFPELLRATVRRGNLFVPQYAVQCHCKSSTPWLESSADAIQHWRLSNLLSKL